MKDCIQSNTDPNIPYEMDSRSNKIEWSTVSNAALTLRKARFETSPLSVEEKISNNTRSRADSVERCLLNPDWNSGRRLFAVQYSNSSWTTILSMTFAMKERFEVRRYFFISLGSKLGFCNAGVTMAVVWDDGRRPSWREALHNLMRNGSSVSRNSSMRKVGAGSSSQLFEATPPITCTNSYEHNENELNLQVVEEKEGEAEPVVWSNALEFLFHEIKKICRWECWEIG